MERKLFYNGTVFTMDEKQPMAGYVLTEGERILEVGPRAQAAQHLVDGVEAIDLKGRVLLPGFIDSHIHMLTAALNRFKLDITDMTFDTIDSMLDYVKKEKEGSGEEWISVFGFTEENIGTGAMVTRADIDRYFPDIPVTIIRVCGHMSIINSAAIGRLDSDKMASITGGEFKRDAQGQYTGLATEGAQQYVLDSMPDSPEEASLDYLCSEQERLLRCGITAIHDAGTDMMLPRAYVELYERMDEQGLLKLRTSLMVRPGEDEAFVSFNAYLSEVKARRRKGRLSIGAIKLFADGSLGSRTAAVEAHYMNEPENTGLLLNERVDRYATQAADAGHQVAVHAIGDRSTRYVAEHYAASDRCRGSRQRIEHAELLNEELIDHIRDNQLFVMTQPIFIREFGNTYFNNLGDERAMWIQPLRLLLDKGVTVGFGTDYPVDDPDPLLGIAAAMTRRIKGSERLLNREQAISFSEAVKCYTLNNACAAFEEADMGSIERGKLADLVVLSGITPDASGEVHSVDNAVVDMTVIGGQIVYSR